MSMTNSDGGVEPVLASRPVALLIGAIGLAWHRYGRDLLSVTDLARLPLAVLAKLGFYRRILRAPQQGWVRTERGAEMKGRE